MFYKEGKVYTEYEIRGMHPNVSFGVPFDPSVFGYEVVFDTPKPAVEELQIVVQDGTEIDSKGNRIIKWVVKDMFEDYIDYSGVLISKVEQEQNYLAEKNKAMVPNSITPRQARLVLLQNNLLDDLEVLIANDRVLQIWWEYSLEIKRNDERLLQAAVALKLTDEQLDNMFIRAINL